MNPSTGKREGSLNDDRQADSECLVKSDMDRHHSGIESAAGAKALERQDGKPEDRQGRPAEGRTDCSESR